MNLFDVTLFRIWLKRAVPGCKPAMLLFAMLLVSAIGTGTASAATQLSKWRWSNVSRMVVIPDIHGAYAEFTELLQATGVVDETLMWSGGETHLVSLGDLLDRGKDSRKVMELLMRLQQQAPASNGRVHVVNGNHELMNLVADLRYVSRGEYAAFAAEEPDGVRRQAFAEFSAQEAAATQQADTLLDEGALKAEFDERYPPGYFGHRAAFSPEGRYGTWLLSLPLLIVINDIAFVHGGLPQIVADMDLSELNERFASDLTRYLQVWRELVESKILPPYETDRIEEIARELLRSEISPECLEARQTQCGKAAGKGANDSLESNINRMDLLQEFIDLGEAPLLGVDGPTWYRGSVLCRAILEEPVLRSALNRIQADRVIVGHTVTKDFRVHEIHQNKLVMLDTGMLRSHYQGRPAAMIIENGKLVVQYLYPRERTAPIVENRFEAHAMTRQQLIEALSSSPVREVQESESAGHRLVTLGHGNEKIQAIFYAADKNESDHKELAAYHLDQLLGMNLVPPTVQREIEGRKGALQLWYPDTLTEVQRRKGGIALGGWCEMPPQFRLRNVWDLLLLNRGRTAENTLYRKNSWQLRLTGHSEAFPTQRKLPRKLSVDNFALAPGVATALESLNKSALKETLGGWLNKQQIEGLLSRRDRMIRQFGPK